MKKITVFILSSLLAFLLTSTAHAYSTEIFTDNSSAVIGGTYEIQYDITGTFTSLSEATLNIWMDDPFDDGKSYVNVFIDGTQMVTKQRIRYYGYRIKNLDVTNALADGIITVSFTHYKGNVEYLNSELNATGELNIATTHVPIPNAVWVLGSGLLCLLGIRRKFKID